MAVELTDEAKKALQENFVEFVIAKIARAQIVYLDSDANELFWIDCGQVSSGEKLTIQVPTKDTFHIS